VNSSSLQVTKGSASPIVDPIVRDFLDQVASIELLNKAYPQRLDSLQTFVPDDIAVDVSFVDIPPSDGKPNQLRIIRPRNVTGALPVLYYFHGGGSSERGRHTHSRWLSELSLLSQTSIVCLDDACQAQTDINHRVHRAFDIITYLAATADQLQLDPHRIALGGDNLGGYSAAMMAMANAQSKQAGFRLLLLISPVISPFVETPSRSSFSSDTWFSREDLSAMVAVYLFGMASEDKTLLNPHRLRVLDRFPRTMVVTAENDALRDEGEDFARSLIAGGVDVSASRYIGTIHDFMLVDRLADTYASRSAVGHVVAALRNAWLE